MAKSKKNSKNPGKPSVKVQDLKAKKNPKGGAVDMFMKENSALKIKLNTTGTPTLNPSVNFLKIK
jgi:hypothetical protein